MANKAKVPLFQAPQRFVTIEPGATVGAVLGVNLWNADGSLVEIETPAEPTDEYPITYWRLIQEIPPNITALQKAAGTGLFAVTGPGTGAMRTLADSATIEWANGSGVAGNPTPNLKALADTGIGAALVKITRDSYGRVEGQQSATTDDLTEGAANLYYTDDRADARIAVQKGQPHGLATLDGGGKLDAGQLPALAITETFVVASQAAMLALACQQGDVAVRSDQQKSYILTAEPASTLANWQELLVPTAVGVASFNGRTGSVVPATGDYTFAQIASKPTTLAGYGITDSYTDANARSAVITASITNGDTTHSPSGDAVFDALALKAADSAVLHTSGNETATGVKSFTDGTRIAVPSDYWTSAAGVFFGSEGYFGTNGNFAMSFRSNGYRNNSSAWTSLGRGSLAGASGIDLRPQGTIRLGADTSSPVGLDITWRWELSPSELRPFADNAYSLGNASLRPTVLWAVSGTISTSDAREKTAVLPLSPAEIAASTDLSRAIGTYQWLASIAEKGAENARHHVGLTVQRAIEIMQSHGLDPFRYGFICYDQWDEQPEVREEWSEERDDDGNITREAGSEIVQEYQAAGDRYSFRTDELLLFLARGFAARLDAAGL